VGTGEFASLQLSEQPFACGRQAKSFTLPCDERNGSRPEGFRIRRQADVSFGCILHAGVGN
jgi:hypothetical protein